MGQETGKACARRSMDHRFATRYYVGKGIDIGAGNDSIAYYQHMFPLMTQVVSWDKEQGDATYMPGVAEQSFDWVNSSHCLEHLDRPITALNRWIGITKSGGHVICVVPERHMYEHDKWPSVRNDDHKWSFTIGNRSDLRGERNQGVMAMLIHSPYVEVLKIELLDRGFRYGLNEHQIDQSAYVVCEPAIEFVLRVK